MIKKNIAFLLILLCSVLSVSANETHEHGAHEHGVGQMQILVEDLQIEIVIDLPGADFIGFEHQNLTDEEEALIQDKIDDLKASSNDLINFRTRRSMQVLLKHLHIEMSGHEEEHHHEGHEEEEHHEGHEEEEHHEGHEEGHEHMEFELHFTYTLENTDNLRSVQFDDFFKAFPTLSEIRWIMINDSGQAAGELNPSSSRIRF
jgi:G3E family GTPase